MSKIINASKGKIIQKNQNHNRDVGSPEVQVAILTEEIVKLTAHLKNNRKDHSSRRGLLKKVSRRKKLLNYLLGEDPQRYLRVCKKNNIRPNMLLTANLAASKQADLDASRDVEEVIEEQES